MKLLKKNFYLVFKNNLYFLLTNILFLIHQLFYIKRLGTNIDEYVHIVGVEMTLNKLSYMFNNFPWNKYLNYSDIEFYGYIYEIQAYFFSNNNFVNLIADKYLIFETANEKLYYLRHFYLTFYIVVIIFIIRTTLSKILNFKFADIFVIILYLVPVFNGYALSNHKDITYSIHLFLAACLYFLYINRKVNLLLTAFFISYVMLLRINAIAFISIFAILVIINNENKKLSHYIKINLQLFFATILFYLLGILPGWPIFIKYLKNLYNTQFKYAWIGSTLINGVDYDSISYKFDYLLKISFYKLPIFFLIIFIFSVYLVIFRKNNQFIKISLLFLLTVNLAFIFYKPNVYDYLRQYLFLIPFYVSVVSYFFYILMNKNKKLFYSYFILFIIYLSFSQFGLKEYKYTYLNEFVKVDQISNQADECENGLSICGSWSSDYYGMSGYELFKSNLSTTNITLICTYEHIYSDFIEKENEIYSNEINEILPENEYYITSLDTISNLIVKKSIEKFEVVTIHRINSKGGFCVDKYNNSTVICSLENKISRKLRFEQIDMGYQFLCLVGED